MNYSLKIALGLVVSLSLFSCIKEEKQADGPFIDVLDFKEEASQLSGALIKRVHQSAGIESKTLPSPQWSVELQPFMDANFNTPNNKDKFLKKITYSPLSGWRDVSWISTDENSTVNWAVYRYVDTTCIGVSINVSRESSAYSFEENLTYLPKAGYSIDNRQELTRIDENSFYLSGQFESSPQPWRMFFDIGSQNIPVNFWFNSSTGNNQLTFSQGKEKFTVETTKTDSGLLALMPIFQAYLLFEVVGEEMKGKFVNLDKGTDYAIPFTANRLMYEQAFGYDPNMDDMDFSGKWETYFYNDGDSSAAIGMFDRLGDDLIGTFATATGDYRFLQGKVVGDSFSLSTFDGSHLFLFTGKIDGDKIFDGQFYSGKHYQAQWKASLNENFELIDPNTMTSLKEEEKTIRFSFPDLAGNSVSLTDERFQNKVVILQIMGSWCPNCMDETRYFKELYANYNAKGLEIVGLGFERSKDFATASAVLAKAVKDLNVPYPILIAGTPKESAKALPMITPIRSYPTSIFLNKKGEVVKIHTGFYGPSTGAYYDDYKNETESFIEQLLAE